MLKAGFARLDITPPLGAELSGYFHIRYADGVLDPIYLNTVAVSNEKETLILMAIDFIGIKLDWINKLRKEIHDRTGVAEDHILIAALHQHTSCCLHDNRDTALTDTVYMDVLKRKFGDAAQMAIDDLQDASMYTAAAEVAEPIAFVRRYITADGSVVTNPSSKYTLTGRCAEADNTMRLVRFHREGAKDIAIVNFSTHPDVIGGNKFSADWPGFTRRYVEQDDPDVSCIFFTGCQGDSNHYDYFKPKGERLKGERYEHSSYMGRTVADAVKAAWNNMTLHTGDEIFAKNEIIYNKTNTEDMDRYDYFVQYNEDYNAKRLDPMPAMAEIAYARRVIRLRTAPIFLPVPLTVMGIGDVVFVGFGGEAFTSYGQAVRDLVPDRFVVCSVCTNGYEGYLPTQKAFEQGGYEAKSSLFTPTLEQEILSALKEML